MIKPDILLKQLNLLNLILLAGLVSIIIIFVIPGFSSDITMPLPAPAAGEQPKSEPAAQPVVPPMQEYALVSEKNLFHSKRILPPKKTEEVVQRPEFVLYGTLIMDTLKLAYLSDDKAPRTTPGRGKRQTGLKLGETMSGYRLKDVQHDRILMVRGEDQIEVKVIAPGGKKDRGGDGSGAVSAAPKARPKAKAKAAAAPRPDVRQRPPTTGPRTLPTGARRLRGQTPPNVVRPPVSP
jgi:hypothetical protein